MKYSKPILLSIVLSALACAPMQGQTDANVDHLEAMQFLFMDLDTTRALELDKYAQQDLSDIMELQLLRGEIEVRPKIANAPEANFPMIVVSVDTSRPMGRNEFFITLRVVDAVTIRRNGEQTVATTYTVQRTGGAPSSDQLPTAIKAQLRDLMLDFVTEFKIANP